MRNVVFLLPFFSCLAASGAPTSKLLSFFNAVRDKSEFDMDLIRHQIRSDFPQESEESVDRFIQNWIVTLHLISHVPSWFHELHLAHDKPTIDQIIQASPVGYPLRLFPRTLGLVSNAWRSFGCISSDSCFFVSATEAHHQVQQAYVLRGGAFRRMLHELERRELIKLHLTPEPVEDWLEYDVGIFEEDAELKMIESLKNHT
jgi:hypothetical protein